jgi:hypothetical protein
MSIQASPLAVRESTIIKNKEINSNIIKENGLLGNLTSRLLGVLLGAKK